MNPTLFLSMEWPEIHWQKNNIIGKTVEPSLFLRQPSNKVRLADWWKTDILWVGLQRGNVCLLAFLCNYAIIYLNTRKTLKKMFFLVTGWVAHQYTVGSALRMDFWIYPNLWLLCCEIQLLAEAGKKDFDAKDAL